MIHMCGDAFCRLVVLLRDIGDGRDRRDAEKRAAVASVAVVPGRTRHG